MRKPFLCLVVGLIAIVASASTNRKLTEEAQIFRRLRSGVCTVYGDDGQGSGFLVDPLGIILTNDHVVGASSRIRVKFDDSTRVEAVLLATDSKKDVAAIRVNPTVVAGYPILPLATSADSLAFEGEKVLAIGSPLNQDKIMTTGIVSKIEDTVIISDVNINHGNSGGPLINLDGEVVAINTFGDFSSQGGPGISGCVKITNAFTILDKARAAMNATVMPEARRLPMSSPIPFPIESLRTVAESEWFNRRPYEVSYSVLTGQFNVVVVTPVYDAWRNWRMSARLGRSTQAREQRGGAAASASYDGTREMREWMRYTGTEYAPVVTIQMSPNVGQTAGSVIGNILGATASGMAGSSYYRGSYRYEFKADFLKAEIMRDSTLVDDLNVFRTMIPAVYATADWGGKYTMEDQARTGIFQCDPSVFAPLTNTSDSPGEGAAQEKQGARGKKPQPRKDVFPTIHVKLWSVEKPDKPYKFDLPASTVKRVWEDFAAWRRVAAENGSSDPIGRMDGR